MIKEKDILKLLNREEVLHDLSGAIGYLEDKVVLVTGAGGSIGTELCRQLITMPIKALVMLDIYENGVFFIYEELKNIAKQKDITLAVEIASIRDRGKLAKLFSQYNFDVVFNAAAHKHVHLMEYAPDEAVKNNIVGTDNLAYLSDKHGVSVFVQISSDKAVNPTGVMGATKRACEMLFRAKYQHSKCKFVSVRFGNVLGSNGSVIPLFIKQIEEGGPITLTDERMVRYFMTIKEAVSLLLLTGASANGGEVFVLDMGEPVKIYDLAKKLIALICGDEHAVEIKVVGLREGEKLYEERLYNGEQSSHILSDKISVTKPVSFNVKEFNKQLKKLIKLATKGKEEVKEQLFNLVNLAK